MSTKRRLEENEWRRITRIETIVKRAETSSMEDPVKLVTNSSLRRLLGLKEFGSESIDSVSTKVERIEGVSVSVSVRGVLHYKFPKRVSERERERKPLCLFADHSPYPVVFLILTACFDYGYVGKNH